jgi:pimeloyl-ACP methyl ester carboxylesterase
MITVVEHDGLALRVRDEGPSPGDVVVLLHGFPQDAGCWDRVAPALHGEGLRTLAIDQRGYSPRARPGNVSAYRLSTLADDVLAVMDASGVEKAHVVGHDWGGAVAWHLGAHHADRLTSLTVLSTPHPRALAGSMTRSLQPLRSWYTLAVQIPVLPEMFLSRTLTTSLRLSGLPDDLARRYGQRLSSPSDLRGPLAWYRAVVWRPPWEVIGSLATTPGAITVPTSYLWGSHDPALGRAAAQATGDHVTADYLFVELDAGHWLPEMHPDEVAEAVLDRVRHS